MLNYHNFLIFFHILGVAVGFGGVVMSDYIFLSSMRVGKITKERFEFLKESSRMVWIGVLLMVISGALLFFEFPDRYLASGKFLAKMTLVAILIINGAFFHWYHLPRLKRYLDASLPTLPEFKRHVSTLLIGGAISSVSWLGALLLGVIGRSPYTYWQVVLVYLAILAVGIVGALLLKNKIVPRQ